MCIPIEGGENMTNEELKTIFAEAAKQMSEEFTPANLERLLSGISAATTKSDGPNGALLTAILLGVKLNPKFLFHVLQKICVEQHPSDNIQ